MATKTITVELQAYNKLVSNRIKPKESFSQVIYRATWPKSAATGKSLLAHIQKLESQGDLLTEKEVDQLDNAQLYDLPPKNKWNS